MKPTGYGSWLQEIVIDVADADKAAFAREVGIDPVPHIDDAATARFLWRRKSRSRDDDQAVLWDLTMALGDLAEKASWCVDWRDSKI
ncbi:uncharacterized protein CbrC (UPF0167 family) [Neorhizobium sp. 2083]|uniref:hypothetical protein n=1 Tax=Neorhizobium sp. 2083 TaxID=2817762 RepID=UPI00286466CD|nr:hypothetical protein [Neorhizobium sp. 2083]MDR6819578.1 uncharacterized protein CbrC (UPF0167 family) [Neorhizobium sp. 2083]